MSTRPFHLAWFVSRGFGPKAWREPWAGPAIHRWMMPDIFVDLAKAMERACFDYIMIEDSSNVPYTYKGSHDTYLQYAATSPKLDPAVLVPYLAQATRHLGIIPTLSVTEYPPYLLARLVNSLDHVTEGRVGWNIVTGSNDGGAQNYGLERQYEHDQRYEMADEFVDLVTQLWNSWEPDAVVLDTQTPLFADGRKVHPVDFNGRFFNCRGPLNAPRSPQGRPVLCQAGVSSVGRGFSSKWADTIIAVGATPEAMKQFRDDVRARATAIGRNPDDIKILFLLHPIVDETAEAAHERRQEEKRDNAEHIEMQLALLSRTSGIDFSQFSLDEPLPALTTNGHQGQVAQYVGRTPREITQNRGNIGIELTGTVDAVATQMQELADFVGGDGFLIANTYFSRRYIAEITDGLVPELQRRGMARRHYEGATFRERLLAY
jgi:FMN-dependent oxidoreductase (nitrilotriacetate monooxygenase family)